MQADDRHQALLADRDAKDCRTRSTAGSGRRHSQEERTASADSVGTREQMADVFPDASLEQDRQKSEPNGVDDATAGRSVQAGASGWVRWKPRCSKNGIAPTSWRSKRRKRRLGARIVELEAHLEAEREAANQLVNPDYQP